MFEKFSPKNWIEKFKQGLSKTKEGFVGKVKKLFTFRKKIDEEFWEELEEILITGDVGVACTQKILENLRKVVKEKGLNEPSQLMDALKENIADLLKTHSSALNLNQGYLSVIVFVGVNGTGKTTSIAKLAHRLKKEGKRVILAAADTFRAAAIDQLEIWANRIGVELIKHREGADPAAVVFDAISAAIARRVEVLIIDTAGRLQTKVNLMEELKKIKRVIDREAPGCLTEVLMVLDATTGQNAIQQARLFSQAVNVTGIVIAKLDGTAKGGMILGISDELKIPVKFVGLGETLEDLKELETDTFVEALFENDEK